MKKLIVLCALGLFEMSIATTLGARPVLADDLAHQLGIDDIGSITPNKRVADSFADLYPPEERGFQSGLQTWADTYLAGAWGVNGSFFAAKEWPPEAAYARSK